MPHAGKSANYKPAGKLPFPLLFEYTRTMLFTENTGGKRQKHLLCGIHKRKEDNQQ